VRLGQLGQLGQLALKVSKVFKALLVKLALKVLLAIAQLTITTRQRQTLQVATQQTLI
jgi:hypothetical protein